MLQPEETQRLKISRKKDKWPQLTVKKATRKLKFYWYASWNSFIWLVINKVETQAVVRKISRMSQTGKQLQLWFLVSPLNIRIRLLSSWHENTGLGKKRWWWSIGEIRRQEALLCRSVPSCRWEGTHEDMAQPRSSWMCHFPPHLLNCCRNAAYLQKQ